MNLSRPLARLVFSLFVAFLSALSLEHAALAKPIRDELPNAAREQWDAARELHDAGDFKSALVYFNRAYEISNNPRTLFNVGVCWKDLTKYSEAIKTWERQLTFKKKLPKEDIQKAQTAIRALQQFVSTVEVKADEPGAKLLIDGTEVGVTPFLEPIRIDVGRRQLRLVKDGFETAEKTVDVLRDKVATIEFDLQHVNKTGNVTILVEGPSASTVYMDGRELGASPYTGPVSAGPHTFEARASGYATVQQNVVVVYGDSVSVTLSLAESKDEGKLRVTTEHPDAEIHIDGNLVGQGAWEGLLAAGGHQLEVSKPGYTTERIEITLSPEQQRTVQVSLSSQKSWMFWTVSVVAVVGGATLATVLLSQPTEKTPVYGTLTTVTAF